MVNNASNFDQFKFAMFRSDDISLSIKEEFNELVKAFEQIERLTSQQGDDESENSSKRGNTITLHLLCSRIVEFVKDNPVLGKLFELFAV